MASAGFIVVAGGLIIGGGILQMQNKFSEEAELHWGSSTGWNDASDAFRYALLVLVFLNIWVSISPIFWG